MKNIIFMLMFIVCMNAKGQNSNKFLDYFPSISRDSTIRTRQQFVRLYYKIVDENSFPDSIALKRFFDNDPQKMEDMEIGYNVDDNTYIYTSFIKKVCPFYKIKNEKTYLLCYVIESVAYLSFYDSINNKIENTLIVSDFSDDLGNVVTHSIIFPNNNIVTVQIRSEKINYVLLRIDYKSHTFLELKKIETESNQSDDSIMDNSFDILGISKEGELLEPNEEIKLNQQ